MSSTFSVPREIIFGEGALEHLSKLEGKKATIVTGGSSMKRSGFLDKAKSLLEKAGMEVQIIDGVEPDPSIETCKRGGQQMADFGPDWIVAMGGGSSLDASKVMWVFYEHPEWDFMELVRFNFPQLRTKARLVCIPSTSGTASEITAFTVITDTTNEIKYPIVSPQIVPDIAILDPALPATMPAKITANTGMDVMTHAVEAYVSTAASAYTDPYALEAIKLVFENLENAYKNGDDMTARFNMHNASTIAGMAFSNCSLGIVHSMAHKIGGIYHLTHGEANAIMLPYIIEYNKRECPKYAEIEKALGIDNLENAIRDLNRRVGISATIKDGKNTVIEEESFIAHLDLMSKNAFEDACTLTNPRKTSAADIKKIYEASYCGKR